MEEATRAVRNFRKDLVWVAVILIAAGIIFLAFPDSCSRIICYLIGAAFFIGGVSAIIGYLRLGRVLPFRSFGLVQGTAFIVLGIFIFVNPEFLVGFLSSILGIVLIVDGTLKLQYAVDLLRLHIRGWVSVLVLAIVAAALGVLILVDPFASAEVLMYFIGAALIVDGVSDLATVTYVSRCVKKLKKKVDNAVREATAVDADVTDEIP